MFRSRRDAGEKLGHACAHFKEKNAVVLAIPRGGVEVGYYVAQSIKAEFSTIITRKLPLPDQPEAGFGAIAEDGSSYIVDEIAASLPETVIDKIKTTQIKEIERRKKVLRSDRPLPSLKDKTVILVDDGIATGSTMGASVMLCKNAGAARVVVAAPISGPRVALKMGSEADEVIILEKPSNFRAVAQGYETWYDVSDQEALDLIEQ